MEKKYVPVYEFSFYVGLINLIILFIFSIFDYYFIKYTDYTNYFNRFDYKQTLILLGIVATQLGINVTTLFTTKNNSPCHVFIVFVLGQLAYYVDFEVIDIAIIICLIIILFISLIFNEIIEIILFGLSYNTKRNIMKRAEDDTLAKNDKIEDSNDDDYLVEIKTLSSNEDENNELYIIE